MHSAKSVKNRAETQGSHDDPHKHAAHTEGLHQHHTHHFGSKPPLDQRGNGGHQRAHGRTFNQTGDARHKRARHRKNDCQRQQTCPKTLPLFCLRDGFALFLGQGWPHGGVKLAAYDDVADKYYRKHKGWADASHPQAADGLACNHAVQHHNNAWRHHDAQRAARLNNARNHAFVVATLEHLRHGDGCANGHTRNAQAVHGRNSHHQYNGANGQTARQGAHPYMKHAVKVVGNARF